MSFDTDSQTSTRRTVLKSVGSAGLMGLAGCLSGGDDPGVRTEIVTVEGEERTVVRTVIVEPESVNVRIQAGAPGTSFYAMSAPLGNVLDLHSEDPKIVSTVSTSGGSVSNVRLLIDGETEISTGVASVVHAAFNGNKPFEDSHENIRNLMRGELFPQFYVVREESDIENILDLEGKVVSAGPSGSGMHATHNDLAGLFELEDIDLRTLAHGEGGRALMDRKIDAWFIFIAPDVQSAFEVADLRVIPFTDGQVELIRENWPWIGPSTVTPDELSGMDQDEAQVIGGNSMWAVLDTMDEDIAYELTRVALENPEPIIQNNPVNSKDFSPEFARFDFGVPFHPGAERYYEEVGVL